MDIVIKNNQIVSEQFGKNSQKNKKSILDKINTGFGPEYTISAPGCQNKREYYIHLFKENFLSEFETEEEKAKVRLNLGLLSSKEVQEQIDLKMSGYATKQDVDKIIAGSINLQNYYTKEETEQKLKNLNLNLDLTPTRNSMNGVTSDGVWRHVDATVGEIHRYVQTI